MYNDKIKKTIYKWRESNKDKYNELMREHNKKYYDAHKKKKSDRYYFNKECQRFRNILL